MKGIKRISLLLEKGKEYEKRKLELKLKKEQTADPELTTQPQINYTAATAQLKRENIWHDLH